MKRSVDISLDSLEELIKNELKQHYEWAVEDCEEPTLIEALRIVHNFYCIPQSDEVIE